MTEQQVQAILDEVFTAAKAVVRSRPITLAAVTAAQAVLDVLLPAIWPTVAPRLPVK